VDKFWELFEKNVVISGLLGLALCGAVIYLSVTSQQVPEILAGLAGTAVGYFFGAGKASALVSAVRRVQ